ncbi:MAG: hypothetical protein KF730_17270 [Sphingomonas sp.]|uniref:hypothetical protein n=1 Tax=Sphingomonas sp. TaxID=28214 RepID=UPI0025E48BD9|nr:hypothetical protein [Sphingomonas sp.]MBX3566313.1 hypothetical protein [Sphingomonas sp.]
MDFILRLKPLFAPERRDQLIRIALVFCAALVGIVASFSGFAAMTDGQPVHLLLAAIFTFLLHAMVVYAAHTFARAEGWGMRIPWLLTWLAASGVSVALGFGFFFSLFSSSALATESVGDALSRLLRPATAVQSRYEEMRASARELADHSRSTAKTEVSTGGTCSDGNHVADDGPRQRFRLRQAEIYSSGASYFDRRSGDLTKIINQASGAIAAYDPGKHAETVALLRRAYAEAAAISIDPRIAQWRDQLIASQKELAGTIVDPVNGARFVCPDPVLGARLASALAVTNVPQITDEAPAVEDPSHAASVRRSVELITGKARFDPGKDGTAIAFGSIVDISILMLAMMGARDAPANGSNAGPGNQPRRRRRRPGGGGGGLEAIREELERAAEIPGRVRARLRNRIENGDYLVELLKTFTVFDGKSALIAVPLDGAHALREAIERFAIALWGMGLAKPWASRETARPPRGWELQFNTLTALDGASMMRLYQLDRDVLPSLMLDGWRDPGDDWDRRPQPRAPQGGGRADQPGGAWDPENVNR